MADPSAILVGCLVGGLLAALVRLPPLVGFLVAGFVLSAVGVEAPAELSTIAELGVTVLLFSIGLKVDLRVLLRREVWLTAGAHLVAMTLAGAGLIGLLAAIGIGLVGGDPEKWLIVGFALSFSSTVFVVKVLEDHGASRSFGGRTAIGILVMQDLAAVVFLAVAEGHVPTVWAPLVLLVVPGALVLRKVLDVVGHGELLPLFGVVVALVPGYALFDAVGIEGDIGALVMGTLLASHPASSGLARTLFSVKDLLLVAFFVSIGLSGLPSPAEVAVALLLLLLLPLKALLYAVLLWLCRVRRRTAVFTGTALANFSEFGLIVVVAAPDRLIADRWASVIGTAVAASFVVASLPGRRPEYLAALVRRLLPDRPVDQVTPEDRPIAVGDAQALVLGMGRVGRAAYERLRDQHGLRVLGLETSRERCRQLTDAGLNVAEADATDPEICAAMDLSGVSTVLLAMPFYGHNADALDRLRQRGFPGTIAVVAQHDEDLVRATARGAHAGVQIYDGAGSELADRAVGAWPGTGRA